jgi:hypothetical protein
MVNVRKVLCLSFSLFLSVVSQHVVGEQTLHARDERQLYPRSYLENIDDLSTRTDTFELDARRVEFDDDPEARPDDHIER